MKQRVEEEEVFEMSAFETLLGVRIRLIEAERLLHTNSDALNNPCIMYTIMRFFFLSTGLVFESDGNGIVLEWATALRGGYG